jgi:hypothetical protein
MPHHKGRKQDTDSRGRDWAGGEGIRVRRSQSYSSEELTTSNLTPPYDCPHLRWGDEGREVK